MTDFNKCPTISGTTISGVWAELRNHYGPRAMSDSHEVALRAIDLSEFNVWALEKGKDVNDCALFGRWFNWRCTVGTTDYGNLPSNKVNTHRGISCIPCPYDIKPSNQTIQSWNIRTTLWLGEIPTTTVDHVDEYGQHNYLKVASRGNVWGFECTYSGCPYNINYGYPYFYV